MRERLFQFLQLGRRAVNFESDQIDHSEQLREQRANIVEMRENAFGVGVAFAAEHFITVDSKLVEKILFLGRGFPWHAVARGCFCEGGSTKRGNPALTASTFPGCTLK